MNMLDKVKGISREKWCVLIIMLIAVASRSIGLGAYPGGINVDEAFAGYEAWAMLNYGTDTWGYSNPVYLNVWGSGMSVLNSVLMMPFIKLFCLNTVTIRIHQMLIGVISVYVFYRLLRKLTNVKTALIGMFLMAICPWHIMMSRWGLDCNLAPGFLLFAVYFFVLGLEKGKYLIVSAFFWGLSLYCYATVWILVPMLLLIWCLYCMKHKKLTRSKYVGISVGVLFILALPLLLFVAVNVGWIPEIKGSLLSIPRLLDFRSDEIGKGNLINNIRGLLRLITVQNDGLLWNATSYFGMYYLFSMPIILIGAVLYLKRMVLHMKNKEFGHEIFFLSWIVIAVLIGVMQGVNINKINNIHIPVIVLWAEGTAWICSKGKKFVTGAVIAVYMLSFLCFEVYYYTEYQEQISERQQAGAGEALEKALALKESGYEKVSLPGALRHPAVLFYTEWPLDNYMETVEWQEYPARWLSAESFGCFVWRTDETDIQSVEKDTVYVITADEKEEFEAAGYTVEMTEYCGVAYKSAE